MAVPPVSNPSWSSFLETTTGKAAIAGTAVVVTWVVLTQEYTYAFALVAIGVCAFLFSTRLNQFASQALPPPAQEGSEIDKKLTEWGSQVKEGAKGFVDGVIDLGTAATKTAVIAALPGVGPAVGLSIDGVGGSAKSASGAIINASTDSTMSLLGRSANGSTNSILSFLSRSQSS